MNLRREPQHSQNSGDSSASDSFPASNVGLIGDLVGLNESLPLDGLPEEFDDSGGLGFYCRFARGERRNHSAGRCS